MIQVFEIKIFRLQIWSESERECTGNASALFCAGPCASELSEGQPCLAFGPKMSSSCQVTRNERWNVWQNERWNLDHPGRPNVTCHMSYDMTCHNLVDSPWKEMEKETRHTKVKLGHMWINDDLDDIKCPTEQGIHIETASSKQFTWHLSLCKNRCTYNMK